MDHVAYAKAAPSLRCLRGVVAEGGAPRKLRRVQAANAAEWAWPETMRRVRI
jgi:hypothetical protein